MFKRNFDNSLFCCAPAGASRSLFPSPRHFTDHWGKKKRDWCLTALEKRYSQKAKKMEYFSAEENRFLRAAFSKIRIGLFYSISEHFVRYLFNLFVNFKDPELMKCLLELSNEMRVDFVGIFKDKAFMDSDLTHCCLMNSPKSFKLITDFGGNNEYQRRLCPLYLLQTARFMQGAKLEMGEVIEHFYLYEDDDDNPFQLRSYQILCLHKGHMHGVKHPSSDYEIVLLVLWSTIRNPFLTLDSFTESFRWMDPEMLDDTMKAWNWYDKLVRGPGREEEGPRSLKHLTRCTIRSRLKECYQLPNGIEQLDTPKQLKTYLSLGDFKTGLTFRADENDLIESLSQYREYILQ